MTIFQSVARFTKVEPMASDFVKALTNTYVNFSFAYVNIQQPTFALAAKKVFESITTSCKYEGHSESFEPQYIGQDFFIVYISVKGTYFAYLWK